MSDLAILLNTAVAIISAVLLIVRFRVNPVIALVLGSAYLGLATGLGVTKTVETITGGFGDILSEVGLLIAFGVLMGAMLHELGAIQRLVGFLLRAFGPKRLPYTLALMIGTVLQTIFLDVLLVIAAPLARKIAPRLGRLGTARMATAMAIAGECGIVLMVPGVAALALAGLLDVPLGTMLIFGLILVVPTILISIAIMNFLFSRGFWNPDKDEQPVPESDYDTRVRETGIEDDAPGPNVVHLPHRQAGGVGGVDDGARVHADARGTSVATLPKPVTEPRLIVLFGPLLAALALIATGAIMEIIGVEVGVIEFLTTPVIALLLGLIGTSVVLRVTLGQDRVEKAVISGFKESGQILILTGVGGSLAATVATAGLGDILGGYFSANTVAPLLMVWVIAAGLHVAVGSVTISAITAAGILAPVASVIGLDPVLVALAAGSGSLFMVHVTSNTFWLLQSLLGQTTRGALKSVSVGVSVASVVAISIVLLMSIFF